MVWATERFVQRDLSGASCQVLYVRPDLSAAAGGLDRTPDSTGKCLIQKSSGRAVFYPDTK